MRKLLIGTLAIGALAITAVPASAQFYAGAEPGGVGVRVGPFGVGVGPAYDPYYAYGSGYCHTVRERNILPDGRVIVERHRICD